MRIVFSCLWAVMATLVTIPAQAQVYWSPVNLPGTRGRIVALAADPRNDQVVYAAVSGGGVWKSQDGGSSWSPKLDANFSQQVSSLAIDPHSPDVIYIGTGDDQSHRESEGVARSADGGETWNFGLRFTSKPVWAVAVDPSSPGRVLAASAEGLYLSSDEGGHWTKILADPVTGVAFDASGRIYAGLIGKDGPGTRDHALGSSSDGGATWFYHVLPPNPDSVQTNWVGVLADADSVSAVISYQLNSSDIWAAFASGSPTSHVDFYKSTDSGNSWSVLFQIGKARPPIALLRSGSDFIVAAGNLLIINNEGSGWHAVSTTTNGFHTATFTGGAILLGGDRGLEATVNQEGTAGTISQLPIGRFLSSAFDSLGGIWGAAYTGLFGPGPFPYYTTIADAAVPGIGPVGKVVAAGTGGGNILASANRSVYRSTNAGVTFSTQTVIPDSEARAPFPPLVIDQGIPSSAYIAGRRLYRTGDSGNTWSALAVVDPDPTRVVVALALAPGSRSTLYAATACLPEVANAECPAISVIWRSGSSGQGWTRMGLVTGLVSRLAVDPRLNNTVYAAIGAFPGGPSVSAGISSGDLLQSTNGGAAWTSIQGNLPKVPVNAVVVDPTSLPSQLTQPAQKIYVGTDVGIFLTANAGGQWTDISGGAAWRLPASPVSDLLLRSQDSMLLAATFGRGAYRASSGGFRPSLIVSTLSLSVDLMQDSVAETGVVLRNVSTAPAYDWHFKSLDSWISAPEASGALLPNESRQVPVVVSAKGLQPGRYRGVLQLVRGDEVQNIQLEAQVGGSPAEMTIKTGENATGPVGTSLPLQVQVSDANHLPVPNVNVNFSIIRGEGSLTVRNALTKNSGIAGTILTLPKKAGPVEVRATSGDLSVVFSVTAIAPPVVQNVLDSVTLNGYADFAPGSIVSISGQNLALASARADTSAKLPTVLQNVRVFIANVTGSHALPLISVSPAQIKALIPVDFTIGPYNVGVETNSVPSNQATISVVPFAPGIFTVDNSGHGQGIFLKSNGSAVTADNPADRGENISFYAAGLGGVNPLVEPGQPGTVRNRTVRLPNVYFDLYQAAVVYSGLAPGIAGRYLVTVRVPATVSPGTNVSVSLTIGGIAGNRVTIPVR